MTPYYQDESVTLYCGKAEDVLPALAPVGDSIAFTSPPYNLGRQSGDYANMRGGYLSHSDDLPESEYVEWQQGVISELWRLTSPNGAIFYNHKPVIRDGAARLPTRLVPPDVILRQIIIWDRRIGMNWNPRHFCPQHEWLLLLAHRDFSLASRSHSAPGDVWDIPIDQTGEGHPCAFPIALPRRAIAATTHRLIIDPFAGSGTTLEAAKEAGRRAIGIEKEERYCEIAARRLAQGVLFGAEREAS